MRTTASPALALSTLVLLAGAAAPAALAQSLTPVKYARDGRPVYAPDAPLPRTATPEEKAWGLANPVMLPEGLVDGPTDSAVTALGEYGPTDGLIIAWNGPATWLNILRQIAVQTTTTGQATIYVACNDAATEASARSSLLAAGVPANRLVTLIRPTNAIWMRDYGPRIVYEGDVRIATDHNYNIPSRTLDDNFPPAFAALKKWANYPMPLVHGGGNYHCDSLGRGFATRLVTSENPSLGEPTVISRFLNYWGINTTLFTQFPTSVDGTGHIDMWMQVISPTQVVISDWPNNSGSTQDVICDNAAVTLAGQGWTVIRVPAYLVGGVHYTFTNMVMCNNVVMVPSYTNATASAGNAPALAALQAALPGKTVVQIPSQDIVTAAGVIHCIVMHVPVNKNGLNPGALVRFPNGGQTLNAGESVTLRWGSDDDVGVSNVDIQLSLDGGATFPVTIASAIPDTGSFNWTLPFTGVASTDARLRVVARDADGRTGSDISNSSFVINPPPVPPTFVASGTPAVSDLLDNGNNNGVADPGERSLRLTLGLANNGQTTATAVAATLTSLTPTATASLGGRSYGSLALAQSATNSLPFILSLSPAHPCGQPVQLQLAVTSPEGSGTVNYTIATGLPGGITAPITVSYTGPAVAIPDANAAGVSVPLTVSGVGTIADVNFRFDGTACSTAVGSTTVGLDHSYVSDLDIFLTSPQGTTITLASDVGGSGNNFCQTTLDDDGSFTPIQNATTAQAPFTGNWLPAVPLSTFDGQNANGVWTLRAADFITTDVGSIRRFSLVFRAVAPNICNAPATRCPADIAATDSSPGADSNVDNGDFSLFFTAFFLPGTDPLSTFADVAQTDGAAGADGNVDNGDFSYFFTGFFAGCP